MAADTPVLSTEQVPTPEEEQEWQKCVTDLLALVRLAAMDGYNKKPLDTVDGWMEEVKKRVLLLWLAARERYTALTAHDAIALIEATPENAYERLTKRIPALLKMVPPELIPRARSSMGPGTPTEGEPSGEKGNLPTHRTCNLHADCDAANRRAQEKGGAFADHCHDDCCEDCFGK